jgi:hypothetical protein
MLTLATTRFNEQTWSEHKRWLETHQLKGCIYGTPIRVKDQMGATMLVLEMHNDENRIKAIGLVKKHAEPREDAHLYRIFSDRNYNRYIYKSAYRLVLSEIELLPMEEKIIAILNQLLFKGACHSKRAQGITAVPEWIINNRLVNFTNHFKALFKRYFL